MDTHIPDQGTDTVEQIPTSATPCSRNGPEPEDTSAKRDHKSNNSPEKSGLQNKKRMKSPGRKSKTKSSGNLLESANCPRGERGEPTTPSPKSSTHQPPVSSNSQPTSAALPLPLSPSSSPGANINANDAAALGISRTARRPMNAFLIFCKRHRARVRESNPELDNRGVTRMLGDLWSKLGPEKATYTNLAKQHKEAFLKANPNYKWSGEKGQTGAPRSARKAESGHVTKSTEDSSSSRAMPLSEAEGSSVEIGSKPGNFKSPAAAGQTLSSGDEVMVATDRSSKNQGQGQHQALLQLAEMCSTEMSVTKANFTSSTGPSDSRASTRHDQVKGSSQASTGPPQTLSGSTSNLGPPKKRAKHFLKTDDISANSKQGSGFEKLNCANGPVPEHVPGLKLDGADRQSVHYTGVREAGYDERRQLSHDSSSFVGPRFAVGYSAVTMSDNSIINTRKEHVIYSHPSSDLYRAVGSDSQTREGDFNPLNLSMPRAQGLTGCELVNAEGKILTVAPESRDSANGEHYTLAPTLTNRPAFGDTYASVEWYKSANHRYRKVSSSATESVPSFSPPPPTHHPNDDGSLDLTGASHIPNNSRWNQKMEKDEKLNLPHLSGPDYVDPKFFPMISKHTKAPLTEAFGRVPGKSSDLSCPSSDPAGLSPPVSIVARMMMQQPHQEDGLSRAGSAYLPSSKHPCTAGAGNPAEHCQQRQDEHQQLSLPSTRPDMLSKLLSSNSSPGAAGSAQSRHPDFHQWRDPQSGREGAASSLIMTGSSSTPAPFIARHQLPLALPTTSSSLLLSSAKPPFSPSCGASSLSLPPKGSRMPAPSLTLWGSCDSSPISSSRESPLSNPAVMAAGVHSRGDEERAESLDSRMLRQPGTEGQDCKTVPPVLETVKVAPSLGTYSEGKLKKKWTQRMLVEEKMEEDRNRQLLLRASEESKKILSTLDGSSKASPRLGPASLDHRTEWESRTEISSAAPVAPLTLTDPSLSMTPKYGSHPTSKVFGRNGDNPEDSSSVAESLVLQPSHALAPTISKAGAVMNSTTFSSPNVNSPINNMTSRNGVLSLGGSTSATPSTIRAPLAGSTALANGSSILSTCLMAKQPLAAVKSSMSTLGAPTRSFNASSHPKLMLQLSKGTLSSPAALENSLPTSSATSAPAQSFVSSTNPSHLGQGNTLPVSASSSSTLFPFTSNSLLMPSSSSSPLLVISSTVGQPSDTLKVDLGAEGWRGRASPTQTDDQVEGRASLKEVFAPSPVTEANTLRLISPDSKPLAHITSTGPLTQNELEKSRKPDKVASKKGPKGPRKNSLKNGYSSEVAKELPLPKEMTMSSEHKVGRGKRKKKEEADPEAGQTVTAVTADKPKSKRAKRKAAKKEGLPQPACDGTAQQGKDFCANGSDSNLLDKMRILNPIAACGKKIVDHIVEQFVKSSDFGDSYPDTVGTASVEGNPQGYGPALFTKQAEGSTPASNLDNIVVRTLAGEGRLHLPGNSSRDVKPDAEKLPERNNLSGAYSWGKVKEEPEVKREPALFTGHSDPPHKLKASEDNFKPHLKFFGDGEPWRKQKVELDKTTWPPKLFEGCPVAPLVKAEESKQRIFGGNRTWMDEADRRERHLFPACSLVERVVREVCGSSPEKKNCFSCQKKEELPAFTRSGAPSNTNLTKVEDLMLGKAFEPSRGFPATAAQPSERSSVWNTYRQSNDSPTNDDSEKKPSSLVGGGLAVDSLPPQNNLQHGFSQWNNDRAANFSSGAGPNNKKCLSMAELIEHHIHQQEAEDQQRRRNGQQGVEEEEDEEEGEEQLLNQPTLRKSRRANRGQKYQELIKEGFIQPWRDRMARGSSSQEEAADVTLEQKRALKRRPSERDILSTPSPTSAQRSQPSFELERETDNSPAGSAGNTTEKRKKLTSSGAGSRSNGEICRPRSVSKYEEIPQSSSSSASLTSSVSGDDNLDDREKNLTPRSDTGKENCRELDPLEVPKTSAVASVAVTGSRKRKARKHCITRISVVGQAASSESATGTRSSEQTVSESKESGTGLKPKGQVGATGDVKPTSALSSATGGPVLISPACKDLISSPAGKVAARPGKPVPSSTSIVSDQNSITKPGRQLQQNENGTCEQTAAVKPGISCHGDFSNTLKGNLSVVSETPASETSREKSQKTAPNQESKCKKFSEKKENCSSSLDNSSPEEPFRKEENLLSNGCLPIVASPITQSEASHVLLPSNNCQAVTPQTKETKPKKAKNNESPKPKKASKLRKALLSSQTEVQASCASNPVGNADANKAVPACKGKRARSENSNSKNSAAKKPRNKAANPEDSNVPSCRKTSSAKASEGSNKNSGKRKAPKKENTAASAVPNHSSPYLSSPTLSATSCQGTAGNPIASGHHTSCSNQATSAPKPKSAILSAILASAPMVDRPSIGLGGAYLTGKPLDLMNAPSAPGLKTIGFSGSPKSPGQADTAESGRATGLLQAFSSPSATAASSLAQKTLPLSALNTLSSKAARQDEPRLAQSEEMSRSDLVSNCLSALHSPIVPGVVTTLSLPASSLPLSKAMAASPSPSLWQGGAASYMKATSTSKAPTATTTSLPHQPVRGPPALPVAASADSGL